MAPARVGAAGCGPGGVGVARLTQLGAQVPRGVPRGPLRAGLCCDVRLHPRRPLLPSQRSVSVRTRLHRGPLLRAPLPRRPLWPQLPDAVHLRPGAQPQVGCGTLVKGSGGRGRRVLCWSRPESRKAPGAYPWAGQMSLKGKGRGLGDGEGGVLGTAPRLLFGPPLSNGLSPAEGCGGRPTAPAQSSPPPPTAATR